MAAPEPATDIDMSEVELPLAMPSDNSDDSSELDSSSQHSDSDPEWFRSAADEWLPWPLKYPLATSVVEVLASIPLVTPAMRADWFLRCRGRTLRFLVEATPALGVCHHRGQLGAALASCYVVSLWLPHDAIPYADLPMVAPPVPSEDAYGMWVLTVDVKLRRDYYDYRLGQLRAIDHRRRRATRGGAYTDADVDGAVISAGFMRMDTLRTDLLPAALLLDVME